MQVVLEFTPDVVLLDIGLPLVDGFQVARWIRRQPALRGTLLVALTGYGRESDRQRTAEAGFNYHLVKPVDVSRIEGILANAARSSRDDITIKVGEGPDGRQIRQDDQ